MLNSFSTISKRIWLHWGMQLKSPTDRHSKLLLGRLGQVDIWNSIFGFPLRGKFWPLIDASNFFTWMEFCNRQSVSGERFIYLFAIRNWDHIFTIFFLPDSKGSLKAILHERLQILCKRVFRILCRYLYMIPTKFEVNTFWINYLIPPCNLKRFMGRRGEKGKKVPWRLVGLAGVADDRGVVDIMKERFLMIAAADRCRKSANPSFISTLPLANWADRIGQN